MTLEEQIDRELRILENLSNVLDRVEKLAEKPTRIELDYSKITDIEVDGIDPNDAPGFCDAFISSATYDGRDMTDDELEILNDDSDFVYAQVERKLY